MSTDETQINNKVTQIAGSDYVVWRFDLLIRESYTQRLGLN